MRLSGKVRDLGILARQIGKGEEIEESTLRSGRRQRKISEVRKLLCQVAVRKLRYPAATIRLSKYKRNHEKMVAILKNKGIANKRGNPGHC